MAIKNYTTTKNVAETVGEIQAMLANHGAKRVMIDYEGGIPCEIKFIRKDSI